MAHGKRESLQPQFPYPGLGLQSKLCFAKTRHAVRRLIKFAHQDAILKEITGCGLTIDGMEKKEDF